MVKPRLRRDQRRVGVRVVLGRRDEALLRALSRFRIARTEDLTTLYFRDARRDTAAARLRRLHDAGFVTARAGGVNEQNVYELGPLGRAWAEDHGVVTGKPPAPPVRHHLAVVKAWVRLAAALARDEQLRLRRFEPDWELRQRLAGSGAGVMPDAVVEIACFVGVPSQVIRAALEVDLTTERPVTLRRKLSSYDISRCFPEEGPVMLAVMLFGAQARRAASVRMLVEEHWGGPSLVCLESEWPGKLMERLRQGPISDSPDGKGRFVATNSAKSKTSGG